MTTFIPGAVVKEFTTKKGKNAVIRYPKWEDLEAMTDFINTLSKEDTYIGFSGEQMTLKEEADFLCEIHKKVEFGDMAYLCCEVNGQYVGSSDVTRYEAARKRSRHLGMFGLVIAKDYRGEGIGFELAQATIEEAEKRIEGLKLIGLEVYEQNTPAQELYKKLGFVEQARIPDIIQYKNEYTPGVLMYRKVE